jgi:cytochrome c biogenesis protein CcdA
VPPGGYAAPASLSGNTIALLVVSGILTLSTCFLGILGLIFGIVAATKKDEPAESAKYTRWGWIAMVASFVFAFLAVVLLIAIAAISSNTSSTGY